MNSSVVGRHAGEAFGEKNGILLLRGPGLEPGGRLQTARCGSPRADALRVARRGGTWRGFRISVPSSERSRWLLSAVAATEQVEEPVLELGEHTELVEGLLQPERLGSVALDLGEQGLDARRLGGGSIPRPGAARGRRARAQAAAKPRVAPSPPGSQTRSSAGSVPRAARRPSFADSAWGLQRAEVEREPEEGRSAPAGPAARRRGTGGDPRRSESHRAGRPRRSRARRPRRPGARSGRTPRPLASGSQPGGSESRSSGRARSHEHARLLARGHVGPHGREGDHARDAQLLRRLEQAVGVAQLTPGRLDLAHEDRQVAHPVGVLPREQPARGHRGRLEPRRPRSRGSASRPRRLGSAFRRSGARRGGRPGTAPAPVATCPMPGQAAISQGFVQCVLQGVLHRAPPRRPAALDTRQHTARQRKPRPGTACPVDLTEISAVGVRSGTPAPGSALRWIARATSPRRVGSEGLHALPRPRPGPRARLESAPGSRSTGLDRCRGRRSPR